MENYYSICLECGKRDFSYNSLKSHLRDFHHIRMSEYRVKHGIPKRKCNKYGNYETEVVCVVCGRKRMARTSYMVAQEKRTGQFRYSCGKNECYQALKKLRQRETLSTPEAKARKIAAGRATWDKRGRSIKKVFEFDCCVCGKHRSFLLSPAKYLAKKDRTLHHTCSPHCRAVYAAAHTCTRDTKPELLVKSFLFNSKIKFKPQEIVHFDFPVLGQRFTVVDFLINAEIVIYVDGCYYHGCRLCGLPGIKNNAIKDPLITRMLESMGYRVVRIWEHELKDPLWQSKLLSEIQASPIK